MNKKQFIVLLVVVVVLGVWGFNRWRNQTSSWTGGGSAVGQKLLGEFPVNDVAQISIKQGANELTLTKKDDLWRVAQRGGYPASFSEISSLLLKLKDLKIVQTEQIGPSQLPRLELAASGTNQPTEVEFRDAGGKAIKSLTLGKKHMKAGAPGSPLDEFGGGGGWPDGRYVQTTDSKDRVVLISDPLTDLTPEAGRWLNKAFFKIEKPKSIAVAFTETTNSWELVRDTEGGELKLQDAKEGEALDSGKASGVGSPFSYPSFNDVAVGVSAAETGLDQPTTINVTTFDGFDYAIKVGSKTNDNCFMTVAVAATLEKVRPAAENESPEDKARLDKEFADNIKKLEDKLVAEKALGAWTFLVSSWTVDSLLKQRSELMVEKAETPAPEESHTHDHTELPPGS